MVYRAQVHITPNTLTELTAFVESDVGSFAGVYTLDNCTDDGTYLIFGVPYSSTATAKIYTQGYVPQTVNIDANNVSSDYYVALVSTQDYSNTVNNNNTYYCKDSYGRSYTDSVLSYLDDAKADNTLSNVSSIDSNSAVQTALDGKADTSLSNLNSTGQAVIDGKVSKSGDTMTGDLNISKTSPQVHLINTDMELGVTPSENYVSNLRFIDKNETNLGSCYLRQQSSGITDINLNCINPSGGSAATLRVGFNANGDAYSTFPNTYRCDGQWIAESQTICSGRTAETSDKNWTLNLPNDSYDYEVLLVGAVTTGATSGNQSRINLQSSIIQSNIVICNAQTRTSSTVTTYGACIIPVGSNHTVTVVGWGSNTGAYSLYLRGYRRIGTNE